MAIMKPYMTGRFPAFGISIGRLEFESMAIQGRREPGAPWESRDWLLEPTFYFRGGGVAGRLEGLYNLYVTQRLILQPQIELNFFGTRDPSRGIGTGLSNLDGGVRLGYQISRKFAPYLGLTYTGTYGETATFARRAGQSTHAARLAFGIWVWR